MFVVGIDAGNYEVKTMGPYGVDRFPSDLGEYRDRRLVQKFTHNDMIWEYRGRKGFAGTLARFESEFNGSMLGDTKAHTDCLIRALLALHRYAHMDYYRIVVGQPIGKHIDAEKEKIKAMLRGRHEITVNGETKSFTIERVEVAAEAGAAFWSAPRDGLVHVLDVGSGTVGGATLIDKKYIDRDSFSLSFGANTTKTYDLEAMARKIATEAHKWGKNDAVLLAGGIAEEILPHIRTYFPRAEVLRPLIRRADTFEELHPCFANAVGFYEIGRWRYHEDRAQARGV